MNSPNNHYRQINLVKHWQERIKSRLLDYKTLFQACLVAISLQVILLPILWLIGWALPWPKPPIFTTIIEYDLDTSQLGFKPKAVYEYKDPKLNP